MRKGRGGVVGLCARVGLCAAATCALAAAVRALAARVGSCVFLFACILLLRPIFCARFILRGLLNLRGGGINGFPQVGKPAFKARELLRRVIEGLAACGGKLCGGLGEGRKGFSFGACRIKLCDSGIKAVLQKPCISLYAFPAVLRGKCGCGINKRLRSRFGKLFVNAFLQCRCPLIGDMGSDGVLLLVCVIEDACVVCALAFITFRSASVF